MTAIYAFGLIAVATVCLIAIIFKVIAVVFGFLFNTKRRTDDDDWEEVQKIIDSI